MGFLLMLVINRELNQTVSGVQNKFHRLEDLINGHSGVNDRNFNEVNTLISSISRCLREGYARVDRLGYAEKVSLLLPCTNGRKYSWMEWNAFAYMCVQQAMMFVNHFKPGYYR